MFAFGLLQPGLDIASSGIRLVESLEINLLVEV
jgi:hypothetical protein